MTGGSVDAEKPRLGRSGSGLRRDRRAVYGSVDSERPTRSAVSGRAPPRPPPAVRRRGPVRRARWPPETPPWSRRRPWAPDRPRPRAPAQDKRPLISPAQQAARCGKPERPQVWRATARRQRPPRRTTPASPDSSCAHALRRHVRVLARGPRQAPRHWLGLTEIGTFRYGARAGSGAASSTDEPTKL